ncbi:MAG: cell division protein FtsB [Granulosicoccus sp.]|jgi:cell division protein FtsB
MERVKEFWFKAYPIIRNKYVFTGVAFVLWVSFFDENSMIDQVRGTHKVSQLEESMEFYSKEIRKSQEDLNVLATNQERLERFAREKYLMKKDNEDIFVLTTK